MQISKKRKKSSDNGMQEEALNLTRNRESVKFTVVHNYMEKRRSLQYLRMKDKEKNRSLLIMC